MHRFGGLSNQASDAWPPGDNLVKRAGQCIPTRHLFYQRSTIVNQPLRQ
jgi:hypothetical protein